MHSELNRIGFASVRIEQVDAGTVIKDERTLQEFEVTDQNFVRRGHVIYCTEKTVSLIRKQIPLG